ncbi:MAG: metallophosphoesterase [Deltaproteobacteria bacterium]|nr:MAG: metallophosphoesterase [Deltaproteobacteria bacterium]
MKLWALSDLHLNHAANVEALHRLTPHTDDWLILAGDVGETPQQLAAGLAILLPKFARIVWVPGNHELWTMPKEGPDGLRGEARYAEYVRVCRALDVLTPEDPYPVWHGEGGPLRLCPLFLLYDYTFSPDGYGPDEARAWAREDNIVCVDERLLHPDPHPTREAWCAARLEATAARLDALPDGERTVLINHWPLREDLIRLFRIPRFSPWCGTRHTEDWHLRYRAAVVVSGHLHMRATDWRDGTRFEEVSLGYPRHWSDEVHVDEYLREILPGPERVEGHAGPLWRRYGRVGV